jgi:hypothetical protein
MKRTSITNNKIECANPKTFWRNKVSLTVHLERLLLPIEGEDLDTLYSRLYCEQFGERCYRLISARMSKVMVKLDALLKEDKLDPATYIRANFYMLSKWVKERDGRTVFPNMLLGYKAKGRYNAYIRKTNRHQDTTHTALDYATQIGSLRRYLFQHELEHGRTLLAFARQGNTRSSSQLTESCKKDHRILMAQMSNDKLFGREIISREQNLARLRASVSIAENQQHGLGNRIGFKPPFRWDSYIALLVTLQEVTPRNTTPTQRNLGQHWGSVV